MLKVKAFRTSQVMCYGKWFVLRVSGFEFQVVARIFHQEISSWTIPPRKCSRQGQNSCENVYIKCAI